MTSLSLWIPGPPRGQGRARFARTKGGGVRTFTPADTRTYAQRIHTEWAEAGRPKLPKGPYELQIIVLHERPDSHYRRDGLTLSSVGRRHPLPDKPDLDNVVKLVLDALCGVGALPDDRYVGEIRAGKRWLRLQTDAHAGPGVLIEALSWEDA